MRRTITIRDTHSHTPAPIQKSHSLSLSGIIQYQKKIRNISSLSLSIYIPLFVANCVIFVAVFRYSLARESIFMLKSSTVVKDTVRFLTMSV